MTISTPAATTRTGVTLGIIGTAGRRDDAPRMSAALQARMVATASAIAQKVGATRLVSGGAAWADHVAVQLALEGIAGGPAGLVLHLPAALGSQRFDTAVQDGRTSNMYHEAFQRLTGIRSREQLCQVISAGATAIVHPGGFKARNSDVARDATVLLAFTFGNGVPWEICTHADVSAARAGLKDGGTADTWGKCRAHIKLHVCLAA